MAYLLLNIKGMLLQQMVKSVAQENTSRETSPQYIRDEDMVFRRFGEEMVLVPVRRGIGDFDSFYVLNEVAYFLWNQLKTQRHVNELVDLVLAAFDTTDDQQVLRDIEEFLQELLQLQAIKEVP